MRSANLCFIAVVSFQQYAYCAEPVGPRVAVDIAGQFSSDPNSIVDGDPATFPLPSLLGGSFVGSFEYRTDAVGIVQGVRDFPLSATSIDVFDNSGHHVHHIELPTSGEPANPLKISDGIAIFYLGPSSFTQSGHLPRMPTFIAFDLRSDAFSLSNVHPPAAAALNSASVGNLFGYGPFVELDEIDSSYTWDLPIVSLSIAAREIPEPCGCAMLLSLALVALGHRYGRGN